MSDAVYAKCFQHVQRLDARQRYAERECGGYDRLTWVAGYTAAIDDASEEIAQLRAGAGPRPGDLVHEGN
ncbi:hypothetical protein GCM10028796_46940 [Ramlibacter monticola]|uniref:Uncharacterized protein n=1 Tax=Ramlibacter monticola TaxID=1926872 RepID=A0A936Z5H3_9BURK|nr:hypothetical protein [Ramlibacter monticola]MBL0394319.1 hypothetical protein [Ramlibacter monticola]